MLCSSLFGVTDAGVQSCVGVVGASSVGGGGPVTLTMRTVNGRTLVDSSYPVQLMSCETYGLDYWQPFLAAWVLAAVAIVAARMAYERIFGTPTEA